MCNRNHTVYACGHKSPIHATPRPPTRESPRLEWPTHPRTTLTLCHDGMYRGSRCPGRLEKLDESKWILRKLEVRCDECQEESMETMEREREQEEPKRENEVAVEMEDCEDGDFVNISTIDKQG